MKSLVSILFCSTILPARTDAKDMKQIVAPASATADDSYVKGTGGALFLNEPARSAPTHIVNTSMLNYGAQLSVIAPS